MGRPEPAAASSSPSARLRVQSVDRSGTIGERPAGALRWFFFFLPRIVPIGSGFPRGALEPGVELGAEEVRRLAELARASELHERALRLLAGAAHSTRGAWSASCSRGAPSRPCWPRSSRAWPPRGCWTTGSYAEAWVRLRLARHPEGPGPLLAGLQRRGVPRELAEQAVRASSPRRPSARGRRGPGREAPAPFGHDPGTPARRRWPGGASAAASSGSCWGHEHLRRRGDPGAVAVAPARGGPGPAPSDRRPVDDAGVGGGHHAGEALQGIVRGGRHASPRRGRRRSAALRRSSSAMAPEKEIGESRNSSRREGARRSRALQDALLGRLGDPAGSVAAVHARGVAQDAVVGQKTG